MRALRRRLAASGVRRRAAGLVLALAACARQPAGTPAPAPAPLAVDDLTPLPHCLVVRSPDGRRRRAGDAACARRVRPASTFKIANALIGADLELLDGPDAILRYDATRYPPDPQWPVDWARDHSLREALAISAVPLFRSLATEIGADSMQAYLDNFAYGNRSLGGGLDRFWLDGDLAISADEQVGFLSRLVAGTLPVSTRAHDIVRAAMPSEVAGDVALRWKTGTAALEDGPWIGWLVGWVERRDGAHVFACWIEVPGTLADARAHRQAFCRGALDRLGLFPATTAALARRAPATRR